MPKAANSSCRFAKKNASSNLYVAHMALALYTMIKPIESSKNVIKIKMKSGDLLFVDTPNTPSFLSLRVRALILAYARRL